jgi:hypothetical protein
MDRLAAHNQKAMLNIAPVFWTYKEAPIPGSDVWAYSQVQYPDWKARWDTWIAANPTVFTPSRVLSVTPFDEPMNAGLNMKEYEAVCAYIKATLPWVKVMHVDGLSSAAKGNVATYIHDGGKLPNVDIIAIDAYCIHPTDNAEYLSFVSLYKDSFPGKQWFYILDGFWDANHVKAFGPDINVMATVAEEYYQVAESDPDAIGIGTFIWEGGDTSNWIQSSAFPTFVLIEHKSVGDRIISRPAVHHLIHQQGVFAPAPHSGRN